jgi:hypothetical protein
VYSLWKTQAAANGATDEELMQRGKQRLQEQLAAAAAQAKDFAADM